MILIYVISSILLLVLMISYFKINTFLSLFLVAVLLGICLQLPVDDIFKTIKAGFGHTLEKIGLLIIFGVVLGEILEQTHATDAIAQYILLKFGVQNQSLAMLVIGFVVGLPIFCDSGFIILSGLIFSLGHRSSKKPLVICLAGALYAVHCLVPPHPGILAATTKLNANIGLTMLFGTVLAIVPAIVVYVFSRFFKTEKPESAPNLPLSFEHKEFSFSTFQAFLPLWLPIFLMAIKAIFSVIPALNDSILKTIFSFLGEPSMALLVGVFAALPLLKIKNNAELNKIFNVSFAKSGHILAVVAAGGMFGEMVKLAIEKVDLNAIDFDLGIYWIFVPFLLTAFFKTAQGSSTVAILSAVSILQPLMVSMGINDTVKLELFLMAMGAGSMLVSHANDAYFWVVTNFAKQEESISFRTHTPMSVLMGVSSIIVLFLISLFV